MNEELIKSINEKCPINQGIFIEPYGIPITVKEHVVYCRYRTGGSSTGGYWDDSSSETYTGGVPKDRLKVLDLVLEELFPDIGDSQYKQIEELIKNNEDPEMEYYGNSKNWKCEYIILSELEFLIEDLKRE